MNTHCHRQHVLCRMLLGSKHPRVCQSRGSEAPKACSSYQAALPSMPQYALAPSCCLVLLPLLLKYPGNHRSWVSFLQYGGATLTQRCRPTLTRGETVMKPLWRCPSVTIRMDMLRICKGANGHNSRVWATTLQPSARGFDRAIRRVLPNLST